VLLGFFGVVRRPLDFVLDRGFFVTPPDVVFGVFGVLSALGVMFFSLNFVGTVFPLVGVFCSAARVVARFAGATFFFLFDLCVGLVFFALVMLRVRCGRE
jgi:hypothetical protein